MPANVESMFSVKETPWHGLGNVINDAPTLEDGIKLAGLDWSVDVQSLLRPDGTNVDEFAKVFVRSDTNATLSVVGPNTHPLQNVHAFDFFQPFVDSKECSLETAGSLDEGRKIWVMAKINRPNSEIVKGDAVAKFVMLSNSHDGTTAVRVGFTPIRIVCANTLAMAHKDKESKLIRVRHSKDVKSNVEAIQTTIDAANEAFEATAEQYRYLASVNINQNDVRTYVKLVLNLDDDDTKISTRSKNVLDAIIERHNVATAGMGMRALVAHLVDEQIAKAKAEAVNVTDLVLANMESGRGTENAASRGTLWTAYNAMTEYLNYEKGNSNDTRMNSLWFGANKKLNDEALDVAMQMAKEKE